ncbi:MAG: hypothetical protein AB1782_20240, partial [Cyanobacteriota bacterium]
TIALTKFPEDISKLYAVDLLGAACGCVILVYLLELIDVPSSVFVVSFMVAISAYLFANSANNKLIAKKTKLFCVLLILVISINSYLAYIQKPLIRPLWIRGEKAAVSLYQKWNSFSRINVEGSIDKPVMIKGWGFSSSSDLNIKRNQLKLSIDSNASTVITEFKGNLKELEYLKLDNTNLVHFIKPDSTVLVIGSGGGRDILSALVFDQKSVKGLELNNIIINTVNDVFGDFSGHLDRLPNVSFVNDEARSYITRSKCKFDIIQISLIDTWAATAAGAFVLAENSLYTVEAWRIFLNHLNSDGIFSVSRYHYPERPSETLRSVSLAAETLRNIGVTNPKEHIFISVSYVSDRIGLATILVSKTAFSSEQLTLLKQKCAELGFEVIQSPEASHNEDFEYILTNNNLNKFFKNYPLKIFPPTDDKPFFFNMLRFKDIFNSSIHKDGVNIFNLKAIVILAYIIVIVTILALMCIIAPLVLKTPKNTLKTSVPFLFYFAAIGFGFMFIEISQMQRLIIFLGHPVYALSVVLFTLLIASGIGSYLTNKLNKENCKKLSLKFMVLILTSLLIFGLITPVALDMFRESENYIRILVASGILFSIGIFMGTAFPVGIKSAAESKEYLTPLLWGINGAASVCASVYSIAIAIEYGINVTFWVGFVFYIIAMVSLIFINSAKIILDK